MRVPHQVRVTATSPATTDVDEIEDRLTIACEKYFTEHPYRDRVPFVGITGIETISMESGRWKVTAQFASRGAWSEYSTEGSFCTAFDTTGGSTQHISASLDTTLWYGKKAPAEAERLIGWHSDGSVDGADVIVPEMRWSFDAQLPASVVTNAYLRSLFFLTGKMNNATYRGFQRGEVLFLGAGGRRENLGLWNMSFQFATQQNHSIANGNAIVIPGLKYVEGNTIAPGYSVGDVCQIEKFGWDLLWVGYKLDEAKPEDPHKILFPRPESAFVEIVYREADFLATIGM